MDGTDDRSARQAAAGRARGVIVGSLIAFAWSVYGVAILDGRLRAILLAVFAGLTVALLAAARRNLGRSRGLPAPTPAQVAAGKRIWRWFWLNLLVEIVLLNVAVNLLGAPDLRRYWIAAISGVVGLHFRPMAMFFRARSYWFVGIAMTIGGVLAALLIARRPDLAVAVAHAEALCNAAILWSSLIAAAARAGSAGRGL